jgi:3-(3-hydroxy-phenyl)propionate hydroxylase
MAIIIAGSSVTLKDKEWCSMDPIVVAGAGPVGLTVAEILTHNNIPVTVFEKEKELSREWRASTFHAATLELLENTGVSQELLGKGVIAERVQYRDRDTGPYAEFNYRLIKDETKYPFRLQCPQSTYVRLLYERIRGRPTANIHFESEVVGFQQDFDGVTVTIQTPDGQKHVRTPFLFAADGARSTVRRLLGFRFEGYTYEERFLLTATPRPLDQYMSGIAEVNYISHPEQFLFILRVPEAWRFLFPVPPEIPDEIALSDDYIQNVMKNSFLTDDTFPIIEKAIYRVHQRVAERFFQGRVVLLGDAAHVNSPFGGLGLNSGIHDAVDLSIRVLRILEEGTNGRIEAEFEKYSSLRRKVALQYVRAMSERNSQLMREKDQRLRLQMQREMAEEAADPERAKRWLLNSSLLTSIRENKIGEYPDI